MTNWNGSTRRARLIGLTMLIGAFLAGALTGAAVIRVLSAGEPAAPPAARAERNRPRGPDMFSQLGLTEEQRREIEAILERRRQQVDAFWDEFGPRIRAIRDSTRSEIRAVLTPEQRELEDRLWKARHARSGKGKGHAHMPPAQEGKQE